MLLTAGISLLPQELGYLPSKYSRHPGLRAALSLKHNHRPAKEKQGGSLHCLWADWWEVGVFVGDRCALRK